MKIRTHKRYRLVFEHRPTLSTLFLGLIFTVVIVAAAFRLGIDPLQSVLVILSSALLGGACVQFLGSRSHFRFDAETGHLTWSHRRVFGGGRSGRLPLEQIQSVEIEEDTSDGTCYRLVLDTSNDGRIPLTECYFGFGRFEPMRDEIRRWLDTARRPATARA